jgi:hypothetical protein
MDALLIMLLVLTVYSYGQSCAYYPLIQGKRT